MSHRHAICLVVDGLRASALGAYGNTSSPTPALDALASRALVADWMWADSPHQAEFYRSVWQGVHSLRAADQRDSLLRQFQQAKVRQWLVSDDPWMTHQAATLPLDEALLFENEADRAADTMEDSTLGRFFAEAVERLPQWRQDVEGCSSLAWLHCRGLYGPWDAPWSLREDLLDDEDPAAADFVQPPTALHDIEDPDVLLNYRTAYAAQVSLLDACIGAFVSAVETLFAGSEMLVLLASSRGFALGEHGSVGSDCVELYGERLHLPWFVYPCGNTTPLPRWSSLSQPADIGCTLLDWFGIAETAGRSDGISCVPALSGTVGDDRRVAVSANAQGERVVRTPAWMLRKQSSDQGAEVAKLFTKPDDRWESNDVAELCPQIVEQLTTLLADYEQCCKSGKSLQLSLSNDELVAPSR
ncbi:MAG: sulfatase-like hydrolase/transferase [Bythopirellula sp.]